jgi:transposase-like protein
MKTETSKSGGTSRVSWHLVDWTHQDIEIAEANACSRERVRQKRKELGKPRAANWHCRRVSAKEKISSLADTSQMTMTEIAKKVGCSNSYALQTLKKLGLKYKRQRIGGVAKYDWGSADWGKSYREIADDLGVDNPGVVSQYRQRHGIRVKRKSSLKLIQEALEQGPLTAAEAALIGDCTERYAKQVLKDELVEIPVSV